MFRHILVPLDGSPLAAAAVPYAVTLARASDARISLLAVVGYVSGDSNLPESVRDGVDARHVTDSAAYLESVALPLREAGLAVTTVVRHGDPADAILTHTETEACSLVVMNTHGRTGLARVRMGSVTRRVLRHATVPTLVVRPGNDALTEGDAVITGVTVSLDGSALAEEALPFAAGIATALSVSLTLLRVIPTVVAGWGAGYDNYYPISEETQRDEEGAVAEYLDATATPLRATGLEVRTAWERSVTNRAVEVIAATLAKQPSGIAVMASHGRGGVMRWTLGSTAEDVLDDAPCPILIIRAGTTLAGRENVPALAAQLAN